MSSTSMGIELQWAWQVSMGSPGHCTQWNIGTLHDVIATMTTIAAIYTGDDWNVFEV